MRRNAPQCAEIRERKTKQYSQPYLLFRREIQTNLDTNSLQFPHFTIWALKQMGLTNDLAMRVLLIDLPNDINYKFLSSVSSILETVKKPALKTKLNTVQAMIGLRSAYLPTLCGVQKLSKPDLLQTIVKTIMIGPETIADRLNESARLQTIYQTIQTIARATPFKRKRTLIEKEPSLCAELPQCPWCRKPSARRSLLRCASDCQTKALKFATSEATQLCRNDLLKIISV